MNGERSEKKKKEKKNLEHARVSCFIRLDSRKLLHGNLTRDKSSGSKI